MGRKPKNRLEYRSAAASARKKKEKLDESTIDDIPVFYVNKPMPPLMECSTDVQTHSATSHNFKDKRFNFHCNLTSKKILMVYTTRLDDMKVISSPYHVSNTENFFAEILAESKPLVTADSFKRRAACNTNISNPMSFLTLKYKIQRVNITIVRENMELRKPESELTEKASGSELDNQCTKIVKDTVKETQLPMQSLTYRNNNIIFKNTMTNASDIYYFNNKGMIIQHYHTKDGTHKFFERTSKTVEAPYCCWQRRKMFVNILSSFLPAKPVKYLQEPHNCVGQCTCCCKNITEVSNMPHSSEVSSIRSPKETTSANVKEINAERIVTLVAPKILLQNLLYMRVYGSEKSLIRKSLVYIHTPQEKPILKNIQVKKCLYLLKETKILFHYDTGNEYYRIGLQGKIIQHVRNASQSFIEEQLSSGGNIINEKVCCWFVRDKLTHTFRKNIMLPDTWKYIRTHHTCPIDKCVCCCKVSKTFRPIINANIERLTLPDIPNCTSEACHKIPPLKFIFAKHKPIIHDVLDLTEDHSTTDNQIVQRKTDTVPCPKKAPIASIVISDNEDEHNDDIDEDEEQRRMFICHNTKLLLEYKLQMLKNISINISPKTKITATLNVPVTKLSTDELKILSEILSQAQKYIDNPEMEVLFGNNFLNDPVVRPTTSNAEISNNSCNTNLPMKKCNLSERRKLYAAYSNWSLAHNELYLKSLISLLKSKQYKKPVNIDVTKAKTSSSYKKTQNRRKRKHNESETTSQELLPKRRTYKRRKPVNGEVPVRLQEIQTEPAIEYEQMHDLAETTKFKDKLKSSDEPPNVFSLAMIVNKPLKLEDRTRTSSPCAAVENPLDPLALIEFDSNHVKLDQVEESPIEQLLCPIKEEVSATQVDDDDCILGA